jgi:hypothetical protein
VDRANAETPLVSGIDVKGKSWLFSTCSKTSYVLFSTLTIYNMAAGRLGLTNFDVNTV